VSARVDVVDVPRMDGSTSRLVVTWEWRRMTVHDPCLGTVRRYGPSVLHAEYADGERVDLGAWCSAERLSLYEVLRALRRQRARA